MIKFSVYTNEQIIETAQYEVDKLSDTDIILLKTEIENRKLNPHLLEAIDIQRNGQSVFDFFENVRFLLNLPCPHCGKKDTPINITRKAQVVSFLIFTGYDKLLTAGCPDCIKKDLDKASRYTRIMGWWGVAGPVRSLQALEYNKIRAEELDKNEPTTDFMKFAYANRGFIIANIENEAELSSLIQTINA